MASPNPPLPDFPRPEAHVSPDLAEAWDLAAFIGQQSRESTLRSFTSMLVALLHGRSEQQRWWLRYCQAVGIDLPAIYTAVNFRPAMLGAMRSRRDAGELPQGKEPVSASLRALVDETLEMRRQLVPDEPDPIDANDMLVAYLIRPVDFHADQLRQWGFEPHRDVSAVVRHAVRGADDDERERVEAFLRTLGALLGKPPDMEAPDPPSPMVISDYAADTPDGPDDLGIEDDVFAMAALITARAVVPPLSVGLFGDWGSGKSFFIRKLQARVAEISAAARRSGRLQNEQPFFKHVVQIEFNAWTYAEGNLWAALTQHILENLRLSRDDEDDEVARRRRRLQQQMQVEREVRAAAVRRKRQARQALAEQERQRAEQQALARRELARLRKVSAADVIKSLELDDGIVGELNALRASLGLQAVDKGAQSVADAVAGTRSLLQRGTALNARIPAEQRGRWLLAGAGVLLAPPLLALAVGALLRYLGTGLDGVGAAAAWASTTLGAAAAWLRGANQWVGTQLERLERLQGRVDQAIEAQQARHRQVLAHIEDRIAQARAGVAEAAAQSEQARDTLRRVQAELDGTTPASVLASFIDQRAASDDYRRHLGLPAMIRRDFKRISDMVRQDNQALLAMTEAAAEDAGATTRINRIVLYIDDLDRCNEARVTEVLEAVHLLLAFELFVVVVAVDARWVTRSLSRRYPGLLTTAPVSEDGAPVEAPGAPGAPHATPYDYLEKIFQVPLWLRPPRPEAVKRMLHSLVSPAAGKPGASTATPRSPVPPSRRADGSQPLTKVARSAESKALALEIDERELACIEELVPLLGHSPRAIKRFVNVYRLFKASQSAEALDSLMDDGGSGGGFRTALLLLALQNGHPAAARTLQTRWRQAAAAGRDGRSPWGHVLGDPGEDIAPELHPLQAWLQATYGDGWADISPGPLGGLIEGAARFSYQGLESAAPAPAHAAR